MHQRTRDFSDGKDGRQMCMLGIAVVDGRLLIFVIYRNPPEGGPSVHDMKASVSMIRSDQIWDIE